MSISTIHPTPYPDANIVLHQLLSEVQTILGDQLVGMYLYGSLAYGDFNPQRSDIDFLVVTADKLSDALITALEAMHARLIANGLEWAERLEGSYLSLAALRRHDPAEGPWPQIHDEHFFIGHHSSDWIIQRHIVRECGIVIAGPDPRPLIDPLSPDDLRWAAMDLLQKRWFPMLDTPTTLCDSEYQAFAILTICRALYTLEHGTSVSKPVAARWAQQVLGEPWIEPIERARTWQDGAPDMLDEALAFIAYTQERVRPLMG